MRRMLDSMVVGVVWILLNTPIYADSPAVSTVKEPAIQPKDRAHWAFIPPVDVAVPVVAGVPVGGNPIDAFIRASLQAKNLSPAPPADRLTLLRRVSLDLIGLPPTPAEAQAFLADKSPDAYEKRVDQMLASPHYGERWAQHWLDVVRYAESNGYEADAERPHAWRYRDYVIRSLNADKPYRQFLLEQVAGDLLAQGKQDLERADLWVATGFHRAGPIHIVGGNSDLEENRQESLTEMVSGFSSAFLGMTVTCARCHDHKFDPISQADYYRIQAFFAGTKNREFNLATDAETLAYKAKRDPLNQQINALRGQIGAIDGPVTQRVKTAKRAALPAELRAALDTPADKRTPLQKTQAQDADTLTKVAWDDIVGALTAEEKAKRVPLRDQLHALEAQLPREPMMIAAVGDSETIPNTHILRRGEVHKKLAVVPSMFPRVLVRSPSEIPKTRRLTRLDLANWLIAPDHPLTARVMVNRIWQHHFGRGIVGSPNDFGIRGDRPTHPELLDFLAREFVRKGWSIKQMHRLMVTSQTYRQSSRVAPSETAKTIDPENHYLWRMNRRRLDGEALRDSMLQVAGRLNPQVGGPPVLIPLEPEVYDLIFTEGEPDGLWPVTPDVNQHRRRSVYLFAKRNVRLPILESFDQPDRLMPCSARPISTFAPQALILMNGPFTLEQSRALAVSLLNEVGTDPAKLIDRIHWRSLGRPARPEETEAMVRFLQDQSTEIRNRQQAKLPIPILEGTPKSVEPALAAALADLALAMLNRNEFVYLP